MAVHDAGVRFSLKDELFNPKKIAYLASLFQSSDSSFAASKFVKQCVTSLVDLELKQRIVHIAATLENFLSKDFGTAAQQIVAALPPPLDPSQTDNDFGDFIFAPLGEFVVRNGLAKRQLALSLRTLRQLTQRFSMEDAIRAFLSEHCEQTLRVLERWTRDKSYHVRRLVSEGTRPRLPWSQRIEIDSSLTLPLLDQLHADPTRYVTRSVANHLNDITKTHPDVAISRLDGWRKLGKQSAVELEWMARHSLRTLVKQGDTNALRLLGYAASPGLEVSGFKVQNSSIRFGDALEFSFTLKAQRDEQLIVDYVIDFVKSNGSLAPKVFKIKKLSLKKGAAVLVSKRHLLLSNATTYKLYPGTHFVRLQINGQAYGTQPFQLQA
ncbi:MAG: hypothetical protein KDB22_15040 [Planctomycetales bacterium]|nr:hypothetical protein [Planctomycetales bacterium]